MKCNKCSNEVECVSLKNKDTGMYYNEWRCKDHGKVDPTQTSNIDDMLNSMLDIWNRAINDRNKAGIVDGLVYGVGTYDSTINSHPMPPKSGPVLDRSKNQNDTIPFPFAPYDESEDPDKS